MTKAKEFKSQIEKQNKEFKEWENSPEGIRYNLDVRGSYNDKENSLIIKTILSIPKKYRKKIIEDVVFFCVSEVYGLADRIDITFTDLLKNKVIACKEKDVKNLNSYMVNSSNAFKIPFIILNFDRIKHKSESAKMDVIAHEIAHIILKDFGWGANSKAERNADDLIEKWGFKRAYSEEQYKWFEKKC